MKVLITFYDVNNPGGMINNQEGLYAGLRRLGHDVDVVRLEWKTSCSRGSATRDTRIMGRQGMMYDQELGWIWPVEKRFAYKGRKNLKKWKQFASRFDLIIWQIPVPTKQKNNFGNLDWLDLYDVPVKQIAYVHDGNFKKMYPWLCAVRKHLIGIAGTHPCAYHSTALMGLPRALVFSAQVNIKRRWSDNPYGKRSPGFLSLQTFKAWKRVPELVRAVPHMSSRVEKKLLAGGGLHYHYMTSKDKLKEEYKIDRRRDPDISEDCAGERIWDVAMYCGMEYLGYIHNKRRDRILSSVRLIVDPSWSHSYSKQGDHINRAVIDGLICGCVPVARNLGVATNPEGNGEFFLANKNYVMVPWNATPREFGEIVSEAANMPRSKYEDMLAAGRELVSHWDYRVVAQGFIDLANERPAGFYKSRGKEKYNPVLEEICQYELDHFFSGRANDKRDSPGQSDPARLL